MTVLLPAITSSPFNTFFDHRLQFFRPSTDLLSPASTKTGKSTKSYKPCRQFSPVSQRSIASAPVARNDENATPTARLVPRPLHDVCNTNPGYRSRKEVLRTKQNIGKQSPSVLHQSSKPRELDHTALTFGNRRRVSEQSTQSPKRRNDDDKAPIKTIETTTDANNDGLKTESPPLSYNASFPEAAPEPFPNFDDNSEPSENGIVTNAFECSEQSTPCENNASIVAPILHADHRQRPSNASSTFVHTIKTASMSNESLSIVPRSFRMGRSSESHGCFRVHSRHSLDSDRPGLGSALDEAAFRRGLKRKQIINELIMTEESYVADLKALVYLYSTLLISTTTALSHTSTAIRRNVNELLHTHEVLLEKLHSATFKAAARKWASTETPTRLATTHRTCRKDLASLAPNSSEHTHSRVRSSIDSADIVKAHIVVGAAEPADILDIAAVFKDISTQFLAYEEYCANHETIAHELQKQMPALWSTYESGMESLSKSLTALNRRRHHDKKGLTVGDLLIKPVQRICKYPLLLENLLKHTPVVDGPAAHQALDTVLGHLREIVQTVNLATDNHVTRSQIQRKWLIRDRLALDITRLSQDQFRGLGTVQLCGVLYLTYQNVASQVKGSYAMCILFDNHLLIATPTIDHVRFDSIALISLPDLHIEAASTKKGLYTFSSLHTWKIVFTAEGDLYEILLTACSRTEEDTWIRGLQGQFQPQRLLELTTMFDQSQVFGDLNAIGNILVPFTPLSQHSPVKRAAASSTPISTYRVILRNTHNAQDWQEFRNLTPTISDKSQSCANANEVLVLAPKRAERTRLEAGLSDVYTKDRLPYPGMIASKGSQIIRASAGTLVRKLSFASMQASFSRRSVSLSSKKSYHTIHTSTVSKNTSTFSIRKQSLSDHPQSRQGRVRELPELDTMDSVIERMIGAGSAKKRLSFSNGEKLVRRNTKSSRSQRVAVCRVGPEDPAAIFYKDDGFVEVKQKEMEVVQEEGKEPLTRKIEKGLGGAKRKRWSNPIARLRVFGNDGLKNTLHSSRP